MRPVARRRKTYCVEFRAVFQLKVAGPVVHKCCEQQLRCERRNANSEASMASRHSRNYTAESSYQINIVAGRCDDFKELVSEDAREDDEDAAEDGKVSKWRRGDEGGDKSRA